MDGPDDIFRKREGEREGRSELRQIETTCLNLHNHVLRNPRYRSEFAQLVAFHKLSGPFGGEDRQATQFLISPLGPGLLAIGDTTD